MNWEAIGAIGELMGATAVVVTLLYLVKQIKQNTQSTEAVGLQTWQSNSTAHWLALAGNRELGQAVATCVYDSRDLSDDTWTQVGAFWLNNFRQFQTTFVMHERDVVDDELFVVEMRMAAQNLKISGVRQWWDAGGRNQLIPRFAKYLDKFDPGEDSNWLWTKETGFVSADQIEGLSVDKS